MLSRAPTPHPPAFPKLISKLSDLFFTLYRLTILSLGVREAIADTHVIEKEQRALKELFEVLPFFPSVPLTLALISTHPLFISLYLVSYCTRVSLNFLKSLLFCNKKHCRIPILPTESQIIRDSCISIPTKNIHLLNSGVMVAFKANGGPNL